MQQIANDQAKTSELSDNSQEGLPKRQRQRVLGIMMVGTTAAIISQSMMIAALPTIMHEFSINAAFGQLLTTSYILMLGIIAAMTAYLVRCTNTKKLFIVAMSLFVVGCLAALFAPNYPLLLLARLLQAVGSGISVPLIQVVAFSIYPRNAYGKAMGLVGLIIGFAPAIGPTISGFLIDSWGWRSVFVVLSVVAAVVIVLAVPFLIDVVKHAAHCERFDTYSSILYAVGFSMIMAGLTVVESKSNLFLVAIAAFVLGVGLLVVFARRQLASSTPLLKISCFSNKTFSVATFLVMVAQIGFMTGAIMVPLFVQEIQGMSATVSGLAILPGAILLGVLNPVTGRFLDAHGPRALLVVGCLLLAGGTLAFVTCDASTPIWMVTVLFGVRTIGVSCLLMPLTAYACASLPPDDLTQATAMINSFRQIFGSLIAAALVAVMSFFSCNERGIDAFGFGVSFEVQAALVMIGLVVGLVFLPRKTRHPSKKPKKTAHV